MNEYEKLRRQAALYRLNYPPGTRVMLLHMTDPHAPVPPGEPSIWWMPSGRCT